MPPKKNKKESPTGSPTPSRSHDIPPAQGAGKSLRPQRTKALAARNFIRSTMESGGGGSPLTGKAALMGKRKVSGKQERAHRVKSIPPFHRKGEGIGLSQCHHSTA